MRQWRHWIPWLLMMGYSVWVFAPFLAPVFIGIDWLTAARGIYFVYSFFCHQLPERSFFLFGEKAMYSLAETQAVWEYTTDSLGLRQFLGTPMGWKAAWSDRMVAFYASVWFFMLWRWGVRNRKTLRVNPKMLIFLLPMALDGASHLLSDLESFEQGFRETNQRLVFLTGNTLPFWFYEGNALGSFNSWMRLGEWCSQQPGEFWNS